MSLWPSRGIRAGSAVACPECGREFARRGLATHRRMRHGPSSPPEIDPPAPIPATRDDTALIARALDETAMIARALDSLAQVVGRLDSRLDGILAQQAVDPAKPEPVAPAASVAAGGTDKQALERELDAVLAEIARLRADSEATAAAQPDGERRPEPAACKRLGKLRRRQATILSRLLEIEGDPGADELGYL